MPARVRSYMSSSDVRYGVRRGVGKYEGEPEGDREGESERKSVGVRSAALDEERVLSAVCERRTRGRREGGVTGGWVVVMDGSGRDRGRVEAVELGGGGRGAVGGGAGRGGAGLRDTRRAVLFEPCHQIVSFIFAERRVDSKQRHTA